MKSIKVWALLSPVCLLVGCGGFICTFDAPRPATTYHATYTDPTSGVEYTSDVISDANGKITISGDGDAECNNFSFWRCYQGELATTDCDLPAVDLDASE